MKKAILNISLETFAKVLMLPPGVTVEAAAITREGFAGDFITLRLEGNALPVGEPTPGCRLSEVLPVYRKETVTTLHSLEVI